MITTELECAADGCSTDAAPTLPDAAAMQPAPTSPACRIIRRGGSPAGTAGHDDEEEMLGYVVEGRALLEMDGQKLILEPGDCVVLPKGVRRRFSVVEPFTMTESPMLPLSTRGGRS